MDPLSVTASVIAILDLTAKLKSYIVDVKHAGTEQEKLLTEISQLHGLLTSLRYRVEAAPAGDAWLNQIKLLAQERGPLDQFREALEEIVKRLPGPAKLEKLKATITWTWDKKHTFEVLLRIERLKTLVLCALAEDISTLTQLILKDTRHLGAQMKQLDSRTADLQTHANRELQHRIAEWLGIPDPSVNYNTALKKRQPNTGQWLLNGADFSQWQNESSSLMWLHGSAGCGKTILSAAALEYLLHLRHTDPSIVIVYFYFDFNDTRKQQVDKMIQSILFQVAQQTDDGQHALRSLYERCGNGQQKPQPDTVSELLYKNLCTTSSTYLILDALDECTERDDLLDFLSNLVRQKLTGLRMLATSRREWDIEQSMGLISDFNINIQSAIVDDDIRTYIEARLATDTKLKKWPEKVRTEILEELMKKAGGMFRWAYCQLESIRLCVRLQKLREVLTSLPKTLDETYERMLQQLESHGHISDALTVLRWLCYSDRPLSLSEIVDVLAIDTIYGTGFSPDERLPEPMEIMVICSSLITTYIKEEIADNDNDNDNNESVTSDDKTDSAITMVRLAHFSVKEFLLSMRCTFMSDLGAPISHRYICEASLRYLLFVTEKGPLDDMVEKKYPLAEYVAEKWWHHMHNTQDKCTPDMISLVLSLTSKGNYPLLRCIQLHDPDHPWLGVNLSRTPSNIAPLMYYTALAGLPDVVRALLGQGAKVNAKGGVFGGALQAASARGHEAVVRLLLDGGAEVNAGGSRALRAASERGHEAVVRLLLDGGAEVNAGGGGDGGALQAASARGHEAVVRLLLDGGAEVNAGGSRALRAASEGGHAAVVRLLLDGGAEVNAKGWSQDTALRAASARGHEAVVRLLLDGGAKVNAKGRCGVTLWRAGSGDTALRAASEQGYAAVVRLLLDGGAKVNAKGLWGDTALRVASEGGHGAVVQLLLDRGAEVNAGGGWRGSALQAASKKGHRAVVQLLLNGGAEVNAKGKDDDTALRAASAGGHEAVVQLLLDRGAEVNPGGGWRGSALWAASAGGHEAVVQLLLDRGAEVNPKAEDDDTALRAASAGGHEAVVQLLLDRGAEVNAGGGWRGSALWAASWEGHAAVVRLLLDGGAEVNAKGRWDDTALWAASARGYEVVVRLLLDGGAEVNAKGADGDTALRAASEQGHAAVVRLLLDGGAEVNAKGKDGDTALRAASAGCHAAVVRLLLDGGAEVNAKGRWDDTALRAASARGYEVVVRLLLDGGAEVNAKGADGDTALRAASEQGHAAVVRLLLDGGVEVNAKGADSDTALRVASALGYEAVVRLLLDGGAEVNAQGQLEATALRAA